MEKAWAFYRRSTDKQELSIEDQRRECQAYAALKGWLIVREFMPAQGYGSGLTIDQDSQFLEMARLAELGNHGVKYLIIYDVSRFGRLRPEDKIYWEQHFKRKGGMQIMYAKDEFKNDGSTVDALLKVLKHSEAHEFSRKLSETTFRGCVSHSRLGHSAGGKAPYGYARALIDATGTIMTVLRDGQRKADKLQHVKWVPGSPQQISTVQRIFSEYDSGLGLNRIVTGLNHDGIPSPRNGHWTKGIVHYMLRNRSYIGERIYNKTSFKKYRRKERGSLLNSRDQWVITENAHEPIVDRSLFERIQTKLKTRTIGQGRTYTFPHLLTGLVVCERCGYKFTGWTKKGNGHAYRYYTCSGYHRIGKSVCRSVNVLADDLEGQIIAAIKGRISSPSWKEELKPILLGLLQQEQSAPIGLNLETVKRQLNAVNRSIQNLLEALKAGLANASLKEELNRLEAEKVALEQDLDRLANLEERKDKTEGALDEILAYADDFEGLWTQQATPEERKEFLKGFVHQVSVSHSDEAIQATCYLYRIPLPKTEMAGYAPYHVPGHSSLKSIAGAGTRLKGFPFPPSEIMPWLVAVPIDVKAAYKHYPSNHPFSSLSIGDERHAQTNSFKG